MSSELVRSLREAVDTYRLLVEGIPAIVYLDAVGEGPSTIYVSPQIREILGFTPEEWREDPGLRLSRMHEDDRERVRIGRRRSAATGLPFSTDYRIRAADGHEVWVRDEAVLVSDQDGEALFWRGVMLDVSEHKHTEERLRRSLEALRRTMEERRTLLARLEEAQEEERRRIAADIHDDTIQTVSAADLQVQALRGRLGDPALEGEIEELHAVLSLAVEGLRHLLIDLRPPALDREGLASALRAYLGNGATRGPLEWTVEDRLEDEPPYEVASALFRIAQEAVTNVRKHAAARRVDMTLASVDGGVRLLVVDDGCGFEAIDVTGSSPGHIGLPTMLERAELVGGQLRVTSDPGGGTTVECWVPVSFDAVDR